MTNLMEVEQEGEEQGKEKEQEDQGTDILTTSESAPSRDDTLLIHPVWLVPASLWYSDGLDEGVLLWNGLQLDDSDIIGEGLVTTVNPVRVLEHKVSQLLLPLNYM